MFGIGNTWNDFVDFVVIPRVQPNEEQILDLSRLFLRGMPMRENTIHRTRTQKRREFPPFEPKT